jgi:hypothetical protein
MARRHGADHSEGMGGEKGMSPRKAMASGAMKGSGNFGVEPYHETHGTPLGTHPDHTAGTGEKGAMADHERGAGPGVHHSKHHHPAQAAPEHGPHHVNGYGHHDRGDSKGV